MNLPYLYGYVDVPLIAAKWGVALLLVVMTIHRSSMLLADWKALRKRRNPRRRYARLMLVRAEIVPAAALALYYLNALLLGDPITAAPLMQRAAVHALWFLLLLALTFPHEAHKRFVEEPEERRAPLRGAARRKGKRG